jgi:hypothetical protein
METSNCFRTGLYHSEDENDLRQNGSRQSNVPRSEHIERNENSNDNENQNEQGGGDQNEQAVETATYQGF